MAAYVGRLAIFLPTSTPATSATTDMPPTTISVVDSLDPTALGGNAAAAALTTTGVRVGRRVMVGVGNGVGLDVNVGVGV